MITTNNPNPDFFAVMDVGGRVLLRANVDAEGVLVMQYDPADLDEAARLFAEHLNNLWRELSKS